MPEIMIDEATFERLQRHAKPFIDTPDMVVSRALDALENLQENYVQEQKNYAVSERAIDPNRLPNLTHTKVLDASVEREPIDRPNWNLLLGRILVQAMKQLRDLEKLKKLCSVHMVNGFKGTEGYRHLPEIDISFQGLPAREACTAIVMVAQSLGIELEIGFVWRQKKDAAFPGEKARLKVAAQKPAEGKAKY